MRAIDADALLKKEIQERRFVFAYKDFLNDELVVRTVYKDLSEFISDAPTLTIDDLRPKGRDPIAPTARRLLSSLKIKRTMYRIFATIAAQICEEVERMREILFRGKSQGDGTWKEGHLVEGPFDDFRIVKEKTYGWIDQADDLVYEDTVGQFTGMLDKNGKRIFEGDVCRFREWSGGEMCWIGNIHYENQQFVISGGPNKECETPFSLALSRFVSENIEVIGAIYDNSELLEVTPDA